MNENFLHYCEKWIQLLEKMKEALAVNVAHSLPALLEQQKTYEVNLGSAILSYSPWGRRRGKETQMKQKEFLKKKKLI